MGANISYIVEFCDASLRTVKRSEKKDLIAAVTCRDALKDTWKDLSSEEKERVEKAVVRTRLYNLGKKEDFSRGMIDEITEVTPA